MSNFRVFVTIDVDDKKGKSAIKDVKAKIDQIPGKKKIQFESNAQGLMGNLRDLTVVLGGVVRGYNMAKRAINEVIAAQELQIENEAKVRTEIQATGGAAGFQADQLIKLAAAWQQQYNIADEVILSAQAKLLSFTNIAGEQFTRTLMASADVAIIMNQDVNAMTETVTQLGKALNDPRVGLTLLNRAGITFTEQQKEQIYALQDENDLMGAQNIILTELERQYGGQAQAIAELETGPLKAYRLALGDLKERMGAVGSSILYDLVTNLKPLIENITEAKIKTGLLIGMAVGLIVTSNKLIKTIKALGVTFNMSTGWIGATATILGTLAAAMILFTKTQRQANTERREDIKAMIEQNEHILKQAERYKTLRDQEALTTTEEEELRSIRDELIEQHPELIRGTQDYETVVTSLKDRIHDLMEEEKSLAASEYIDLYKENRDQINELLDEQSKFFDELEQKATAFQQGYAKSLQQIIADNPTIVSQSRALLEEINSMNREMWAIEQGKKSVSEDEKLILENKLDLYNRAYNYLTEIRTVQETNTELEAQINNILSEQGEKRKVITEDQKAALSPEDVAKYYEAVKFADNEYFAWKKDMIQEEVSKLEISADQKRNLTNKLLDDLIAEYMEFYKISVDKFNIPLTFESPDEADFKEVEDDINEGIEELDLKPIQLPPHRPTTFDDDIRNLDGFFSTTRDVTSGVQDLWSSLTAYKSQLLQNEMNEEIQAVENSGLSEQDKQAKIQNIKEKFQQKEKEMYAKMKPVKIAMAISNTALGVTKALSTYPPPLNFILAALVGAAGVLEIATIEAQKFEKGTDKIQESDLLKIKGVNIGKEDGLVAVKKDEGIVSTEGTQYEFNRAMISLMNHGIDISSLIPQYEMGSILPAPEVFVNSNINSFNDKNITGRLDSVIERLSAVERAVKIGNNNAVGTKGGSSKILIKTDLDGLRFYEEKLSKDIITSEKRGFQDG